MTATVFRPRPVVTSRSVLDPRSGMHFAARSSRCNRLVLPQQAGTPTVQDRSAFRTRLPSPPSTQGAAEPECTGGGPCRGCAVSAAPSNMTTPTLARTASKQRTSATVEGLPTPPNKRSTHALSRRTRTWRCHESNAMPTMPAAQGPVSRVRGRRCRRTPRTRRRAPGRSR